MKKISIAAGLLTGLLMASSLALAHEGVDHGAAKAANGGLMASAGNSTYELVVTKPGKEVKDNPVVVYVTDHDGKKLTTVGASGTFTLLVGKEKTSVALVPDGDNRMKGVAKYAASGPAKAIVSVTLAGKTAEQARFKPFAGDDEDQTAGHKH